MAGYTFEYYTGSAWVKLAARLGGSGDIDEYNQKRIIECYLVNTAANLALAKTKPTVRVLYGGAVKFTGKLLYQYLTYFTIRCKILSLAFLQADGVPFTYYDAGVGTDADELFAAVCTTCGLTAGSCPTDTIRLRFDKADCWKVIELIALYTGKAIVEDGLTISITDKGSAQSYSGVIAQPTRKLDPQQVYTKIYARGTDVDGNIIYGEAGTAGRTKVINASNATGTDTLDLLAAAELAKSKESVAVPLTLPTGECIDWVSGDTLTVSIPYLDMDGSYPIMRITRHNSKSKVEIDAALPTYEQLLEDFGDLQSLGIFPPTPITASNTVRHTNSSFKSTSDHTQYVKLKEIRVGKKIEGTIRIMFVSVTDKEGYFGSYISLRKNGVEIYNELRTGGQTAPVSHYTDQTNFEENDTLELWGMSDEWDDVVLTLYDFDIGYDPSYANLYFINQDPADFVGQHPVNVYKRAASQPATPTAESGVPSGWSLSPPEPDGYPLWLSTCTQSSTDVVVGVWSAPVQLSGDNGADGESGLSSLTIYSSDGIHWHNTFAEGDIYAKTKTFPAQLDMSGLILYLPLDEVSGDAATDYSGEENNGAVTGASVVEGKFGNARDFTAADVSKYVLVPDSEALSPTEEVTVSCWVKAIIIGNTGFIWKGYNYFLYSETDGIPRFSCYDTPGENSYAVANTALAVDEWVFLTGVFGADKKSRIYINAVLQSTVGTIIADIRDSTADLYVGKRGDDIGTSFKGIIDEVRIYNRALSAEEILANYNATAPIFSEAYRIVGEDGAQGPPGEDGADGNDGDDGNQKQHVFKRSATAPDTPTGNGIPSGWSDGFPSGSAMLWMSVAYQAYDGTLIGSWSTPISMSGFIVQYSEDGSTDWHSTATEDDYFMRILQPDGSWSAAIRIRAEVGVTYTASNTPRNYNNEAQPTSNGYYTLLKQIQINEDIIGSIRMMVQVYSYGLYGQIDIRLNNESVEEITDIYGDASPPISHDFENLEAGDTIDIYGLVNDSAEIIASNMTLCYDPNILISVTNVY
ncbi:MAG: LamG domain-containing protein [Candidatus Bathyarchaeota archaeon]|nr:LamG domain-containing protein [Candidatus Bathyarchaeota archaeon]